MKWSHLIQQVARTTGEDTRAVRDILRAMMQVVANAVVHGDEDSVHLRGLGTIERRWRQPRKVRLVSDGRQVQLDGRYSIVFKPARGLRGRLAGLTPQLWRDPAHQAARRLAEALVGDLELYHSFQVPTDLSWELDGAGVRQRCRKAFGPLWERVESTYAGQVPGDVHQEFDHLARVALRRWADAQQGGDDAAVSR